jgi:DNA-binding transcriptional MerR regulator
MEEEVKFECENTCFLLAEIGKFDLALELAMLLNLSESIGYSISKIIEILNMEDEQMNIEIGWNEFVFEDNEKLERTIEPIISQLSAS